MGRDYTIRFDIECAYKSNPRSLKPFQPKVENVRLHFMEDCNHMFAVKHNFISFIMTLLSLGDLVLICVGI